MSFGIKEMGIIYKSAKTHCPFSPLKCLTCIGIYTGYIL